MRIAIVHDYLNQFGGAERVALALHEIYPEAPIYTSIYDSARMPEGFRRMDIRVSFMQNLPFIFNLFRYYFSVYPLAFEKFDLSEFEVILSSSSAYAKGVNKREGQLHICYCHTPARFLWRFDDYVKREALPPWIKELLFFFLDPIRKWDLENTKRVDYFIANSRNVAERIKKIYGRESDIINPPVEGNFFRPAGVDGDYFLVISRLNAYKRIDIVVDAFNELGIPLKVIGSGPKRKEFERAAASNIEFLGSLPDVEVAKYAAECRALIFPGEEDFGIVPLEVMAAGRPVIAYQAGGAIETIIDGKTGCFFKEQTPQALIQAVKRFQFEVFDKKVIREHALKYDKEVFKRKIEELVREKYEKKFRQ